MIKKIAFGLVLVVGFLAVWLAVFPPSHSRKMTNHIRALKNVRNVISAEQAFSAKNPEGYTCDLQQLSPHVGGVLAGGEASSYKFALLGCKVDAGGRVASYQVTAVPLNREVGDFGFCANELGQVWYSESGSPQDCLTRRVPSPKKYDK
jgi:hypothetical protein